MQDRIIYLADVAYRVDFGDRALVRTDRPEDRLRMRELKDEGGYYQTVLYKDSRLRQKEMLEWGESQRLSFEVLIPKKIFQAKFWDDFHNEISINHHAAIGKWNIHVGWHHNPAELAPPTSRVLPEFEISGTEFLVDLERMELRDKYDFRNTISLKYDISVSDNGYRFKYHLQSRNLPEARQVILEDPEIIEVEMPELARLDPEGMAKKCGVSLETVKASSDFELLVDQQMLEQRLKGKLVTIDIAGHDFYVDHMARSLRPHDDFSTMGISFDKMYAYSTDSGDQFIIPYNPKTHELEQYANDITEIPSHLILVEIAHPRLMDPVGYNRVHRRNELEGVQLIGVREHFVARLVDWKEIYADRLVARNKQEKEVQLASKQSKENKTPAMKVRGKGRRH